MRPHKTKVDTYVGSARKKRGRLSIAFDYSLKAASEEKITGKTRGTARFRGSKCNFKEDYRATFVGE